jgi:hypothetical protein
MPLQLCLEARVRVMPALPGAEYFGFQLLDRFEVFSVASAQYKVVLCGGSGYDSIPCTQSAGQSVLFDIDSRPVCDILRERQSLKTEIAQEALRIFMLFLVFCALQKLHVR